MAEPRVVLRDTLLGPPGPEGPQGPAGPPGPGAASADTAVAAYINDDTAPSLTYAALKKRVGRTYVPERFGAVGDGTTDDTAAIQAALDAAGAAGGGTVLLSQRYAFTGVIIQKPGTYLVGTATRQNLAPDADPTIPGLVATAAGAQLRVGNWEAGGPAAGVQDLYVDGDFVGGDPATLAKKGLVRVAGVDVHIKSLHVCRSAGDGIVYDGVQNSSISGCMSTFNVGAALVLDNGAGALSFHGGYYGTSKGGALLMRNTTGEGDAYFFGPTHNTWVGTIFEAYSGQAAPIAEPYAHHVHVSGRANSFVNCNFTGGAANSANAAVLVDSTVSGIPSTTSFFSCLWWTRANHDAVRVAGDSWVSFNGVQEVGDNGTDHALAFVCVDGGIPHVMIDGQVQLAGTDDGTRTFRSINGGSLLQTFNYKDAGQIYRLRAGQVVGWRREGDAAHRFYVDRDGSLVWGDGISGVPTAILQRNPDADGILASGHLRLGNGLARAPGVTLITQVSQNVTIDAHANSVHHLAFFDATSIGTATIANPTDGAELRIGLKTAPGATATMAWPTNCRFASAAPGAVAGQWVFVSFCYEASSGLWLEVGRAVGAPIT